MNTTAKKYWEELFAAMEGERSARSSEWMRPHLRALGRGGPRVVDLGCGTGDDVRVLAGESFRPVGLDLSWNALAFARDMFPRGRFVQADLEARHLPFRDGSFDAAIARCSLHYFTLARVGKIVDDVARILAPGGTFALVVNSLKFLRQRTRYDYTGAKTLEPRTLRFKDGLARHFFTKTELTALLRPHFEIEVAHEGPFRQYDELRIAWTVRARRRAER